MTWRNRWKSCRAVPSLRKDRSPFEAPGAPIVRLGSWNGRRLKQRPAAQFLSIFACCGTFQLYSASVFARSGKCLVVFVLVLSTGLHWAALQTVAWTTMFAANLSSQQSLSEAVGNTFDGKHLCPLCRAIAAAKKSDKKSDALTLKLKFEFPPVADKLVLVAPRIFKTFQGDCRFADSSATKPPVPPPRSFFV